jgi:hypothetical protein
MTCRRSEVGPEKSEHFCHFECLVCGICSASKNDSFFFLDFVNFLIGGGLATPKEFHVNRSKCLVQTLHFDNF